MHFWRKKWLWIFISLLLSTDATAALNYPIDGYGLTGIRRLLRLALILEGEVKGTLPPAGAQKSINEITLQLTGERGVQLAALPPVDPVLQSEIERLFPNRDESYSLALLEISEDRPVRLALRQADRQFPPGSVGKLAIAAGLFSELARLFPGDPEQRRELLKSRMVTADKWIEYDSHEIPIFDPETNKFISRPPQSGDTFSLYEWTDHMLSASANAAASIVWKELILMRGFGPAYPPSYEQEKNYFDTTPKTELRDLAASIVNDPLRAIGIAQRDWQLGSFFTKAGQKIVPGAGGSFGTPTGLLQFLIAVERGMVVDAWSSLEIKRLMYMTARRIRYASSPRLNNAAVYFKSGSQYSCKQEEGFTCGKYMGNVENYMNSVAIVEHDDGRAYMVVLMSNVLRKNSAAEHQSLATFIDKILSN